MYRQKHIFLASALVLGVFNACQETPTGSQETKSEATERNEPSVPPSALSYTLEDYQALYEKEAQAIPALAKRMEGAAIMSLEQLAALEKDVPYEVPNFNQIETEEELQAAEKLLGLSREEIAKNADQIREDRIAGRRYLLFKAILEQFKTGALKPVPLQKTAYFFGLSDDEFWLLFYNPTFIDGTSRAKSDALAFEKEYYGGNSRRTRGDAFRHTIWNHLMADYNSHEVNYESEAAAWAKKFADAHERGGRASTGFYDYEYPTPASALESPMDYHNNARGREHFLSVSRNRGKLNWWGYDSRWVETESVALTKPKIFSKSQGAVLFNSTSQLPNLTGGLVFIE